MQTTFVAIGALRVNFAGKLRLRGNHTVTEYQMSGKLYGQKSGWINHWANFAGNDPFRSPYSNITTSNISSAYIFGGNLSDELDSF